MSEASLAASAARAASIDVSCDWSSLNRLSSDRQPLVDLAKPEPETVLPVVVLLVMEGLEIGLLVGGALVPLVECVRAGARGLVSGLGRFAPLEEIIFVAVLDG